jgi:hypothetical protein
MKFAGNFKIGQFSDFMSSLIIEKKRELKVLSVIFWNSVGRQCHFSGQFTHLIGGWIDPGYGILWVMFSTSCLA